MAEFWVCRECKSLNRAGNSRCYSCHSKYGQAPREAAVIPGSAAPRAQPAQPSQPAAALATAAARPPMSAPPAARPGSPPAGPAWPPLPQPARRADPTPATRPAPPPSLAAARSLYPAKAPTDRTAGKRRFGLHLPRRRSTPGGRFSARGPFFAVTGLSLVTAVLIAFVVLLGAALAVLGLADARTAVATGSVEPLVTALRQPGSLLPTLAGAFVALAAVALLCFAVVVSISTHNAPGLGADLPAIPPGAAARAWPNVVWAQGRIAFALIVPVYLFQVGYGIAGGIVGLVCIELLQRNLPDLEGWLVRPMRHLGDLSDKLALDGARSRLVSIWKVAFVTANVLLIAAWSVPLVAELGRTAAAIGRTAHLPEDVSTRIVDASPTIVTALFVAIGVSLALAVGLLAPIGIGLARRQQTRRVLVVAGLTRQWVRGIPTPSAAPAAPGPLEPLVPEARWAAEAEPDDAAPGQPRVPAWRRREGVRQAEGSTLGDQLERLREQQRATGVAGHVFAPTRVAAPPWARQAFNDAESEPGDPGVPGGPDLEDGDSPAAS